MLHVSDIRCCVVKAVGLVGLENHNFWGGKSQFLCMNIGSWYWGKNHMSGCLCLGKLVALSQLKCCNTFNLFCNTVQYCALLCNTVQYCHLNLFMSWQAGSTLPAQVSWLTNGCHLLFMLQYFQNIHTMCNTVIYSQRCNTCAILCNTVRNCHLLFLLQYFQNTLL